MKVKGYKGFNKDMTCRGFKYEEGKTYKENLNPQCCYQGFHLCTYPLDCLKYYNPSNSVYHEVEALGDIDKEEQGDSKIATNKIKIGAKIDLAGLVKASIEYTQKRAKKSKSSHTRKDYGASSATGYCGASSATGDCGASSATGYRGASSATGYRGASSATGDCGASSATGYRGASSATGDCGASSATGDCGASSATGYRGASSATGDYGASSATGDYGASSATGDCGASSATGYRGASSATGYRGASSATGDCGASSATGYRGASSATGDYGASSATGDYGASSATGDCGASSATGYRGASSAENITAIAVAWGYESKARGVLGSHIVCAEWKYDNNENNWKFVQAKMTKVDGIKIKENVWYRLINGNFIEVDD